MGLMYTQVLDKIGEIEANNEAFDRHQMACEKNSYIFDGAYGVLVISKISSGFKSELSPIKIRLEHRSQCYHVLKRKYFSFLVKFSHKTCFLINFFFRHR